MAEPDAIAVSSDDLVDPRNHAKPPDIPGMGEAAALRRLANDLWNHEFMDAPEWPGFRKWSKVAILHLRGAATRAERKQNAWVSARDAAEIRITTALAGQQAEALGDGDAFNPHGFFVYCLWGRDPDRPLYVGLSSNVLSRLGSHLGDGYRRKRITAVTLTRFATHKKMVEAEVRLIAHYLPPWNTRGCEARDAG